MKTEIESGATTSTDNAGVRLNNSFRELDSVLEGLSGVERSMLPDMEISVVDSILSEALRLAAADFRPGGVGWSVMNVHYLRSWVFSKVRGILAGDDNVLEEAVMNVLDGGPGPNMVFLGDFIPLPRGYYACAPTRVIPIVDGIYALVSGSPSRAFRPRNLKIRVNGLGRWIVDVNSEDLLARNICIQTKDSYLERSIPMHDPQTFMECLASHGLKSEWTMLPGSEAYLGPAAERYGFNWGASSMGIDTSIGRVKIVKMPREFSKYDYFLRIDDSAGAHRIQLDRKELKRALLAYDALARLPRNAILVKRDSVIVLELDFPPPASEMRWICALGGAWLGSSGSRIRWKFPEVARLQVEEMLRDMWLKVDIRGH